MSGLRVVSLAVFGESSHYCANTSFFRRHLGAVIRGYRALFPGWEIRIHHDDSLYQGSYGATLFGLARRGIVRLVRVGQGEQLCKAMLWRMLPVWDPGVEYVISRDVDACPLYSDRVAVEQFIRSGAAVHSISAVPAHNTPLSGGLCGFHAPAFREITRFDSWQAMIDAASPGTTWGTHGADETLLRLTVWPRVRDRVCEHRIGGAPQFDGVQESHATIEGDVDGLPVALRESRTLADYMGICGFNAERAVAFFDATAPEPEIAAAEALAGESSTGEPTRATTARLIIEGTADGWAREPWRRLIVEHSRELGIPVLFVPRP